MFRPRSLAESGTVHHRHMLPANQFRDEDIVTLWNVDAGICIESSTWRHTTYARRLGTPLHGYIAAASQLALNFGQMTLWTFQRRLDRVLFGMIGAEART